MTIAENIKFQGPCRECSPSDMLEPQFLTQANLRSRAREKKFQFRPSPHRRCTGHCREDPIAPHACSAAFLNAHRRTSRARKNLP